MFAVGVCDLPETGGSTFVLVAALFMLVAGVIVSRWVRQSAGRMSVVVAPLVLLSGLVLAPSVTDPCAPQTTTVAPTTTVVPVDPNLVLEIDTTVLGPVPAPTGLDSVSATDESFVYELGLFGEVDVHVDWGDGSFDDVSVAGPFRHIYTTSGKYTITVSGSLTGFGQDPLNADSLGSAHYLTAVRSFGELGITSLAFAFYGSMNLTDVPSRLPAGVTNFFAMFAGASSFNGDVSGWDTGSATDMSRMFEEAALFNQSLGAWDISAVIDMSNMLDQTALSVDNYDATLIGWADIQQAKQPNVSFGAAGLYFSSNGASAHDTLTNPCGNNPSNWQINDAGLDPNSLINNNQFHALVC